METPQNFPTTAATPWHLHGSPGRSRWKASCMAVVPRSASENSAVQGGREALQMLQLKMGHLGSLGTQISQSLTCEGVKGWCPNYPSHFKVSFLITRVVSPKLGQKGPEPWKFGKMPPPVRASWAGCHKKIPYESCVTGWWYTYPSEKWWSESQLGWWNSQYMESHTIPYIIHVFPYINHIFMINKY